jgi:hypothetical protein
MQTLVGGVLLPGRLEFCNQPPCSSNFQYNVYLMARMIISHQCGGKSDGKDKTIVII